MSKHTPGPWVVNADGRMVEAQMPNLRNEYEHICDLRGGIKGQINLSNAHLIAAAPVMYEALKAITSEINLGKLNVRKDFSLLNAHACATKALAQAEGSKP